MTSVTTRLIFLGLVYGAAIGLLLGYVLGRYDTPY
jgi:ABC-type nitrate/sulfonate/bicarbonate transport system permease component